MKNKMISAYLTVYNAIYDFKNKDRGAVDIVAIVILIAVAIGLAVVFRKQLSGLLSNWFGKIESAGNGAVDSATNM